MRSVSRRAAALLCCLLQISAAVPLAGQRAPAPAPVLPTIAVAELTLVRTTGDAAVVRAGTAPLQTIHTGDRIGRTRALVTEITRGRMVLEETFTGADGSPNAAEVIFKDGQKGGTRYLRRPDEKRPATVRPVIVDPPKETGKEK